MMRSIVLVTLAVIFAAGCECLSVPSSDSTPPTAGLVVEYEDTNGQVQSLTLADSDVTINASKNHIIAVVYSGEDDEGLKSIHLDYDMRRYSGNQLIQPTLVAIEVVSDCPRSSLLDSQNLDPGGLAWDYTFTTRAVNWLGGTTRSATITINTQ